MKTVVCPGSFDPITNGHLDIIQRASGIFDQVIVLVAANQEKHNFFTVQERVEMIRRVAEGTGLSNVEVDSDSGLLVNYIQRVGAAAIVKGLRAVSDFEYEFQMSLTNHKLLPECETIFFTTSSRNMYLSSSIVRQVGQLGGDITGFVPPCVYEQIHKKLTTGQSQG
ncbi:MAG: pantetheine-phosphate adenylyltransferase [Angelakisella sp.]|jgi:pantetheine-phosphate adenylyltransferase|nr:pantetheine-phosphate adenylyltransferase [Angelakisella sp.]